MSRSILDMDASTLAKKIKSREVSSREAVNTYIRHIEQVNPFINAMVETRFEVARQEAETCDRKLESGEGQGRLFGVPISVKECFDVTEMKTTGGLISRRGHVASTDAEVVKKLKEEGAIILGKTNTPALCFIQETDNKLYGRTNNPWDVTRTAGGSSGGEAALLAAGGAAVGIGSDIGGSIRFPSHFNGVIGFKSGSHTVSQNGHFPFTEHPLQQRMLGIGAIAKSVDDAELIYEIVSSYSRPGSAASFRVIIPEPSPSLPMGVETKKLFQEVKMRLAQHHECREEMPPYFEKLAHIWQLVMSIDGANEIAQLSVGSTGKAVTEFLKEKSTGKSEFHHYLSWAIIGASLFKPSLQTAEWIYRTLESADEECESYFDNSVLVLPVYHSPAPSHGGVFKDNFSIRKTFLKYMPYVAVANTLGLPALVVPVGTNSRGLPIAVQLISKVGNEQLLFQLGREIEQQFRGYIRCTDHDESTVC